MFLAHILTTQIWYAYNSHSDNAVEMVCL